MTRSKRRRLPLLTGALVLTVAGTLLATGADRPRIGEADDLSPVAAQQPLTPAEDCDALLAAYVEAGLREVTAWGLGPGGWPMPFAVPVNAALGNRDAGRAAALDGAASSSATGTNVQEAGVDEPDLAKTDGAHVFRVWGRRVLVHDVRGSQPRRVARIDLPGRTHGAELLLAGDRLVTMAPVGGHAGPAARSALVDPVHAFPGATRVLVHDVSTPAEPVLVSDEVVHGSLLGARLHGEGADADLRMAFSHGGPRLQWVTPGQGRTRKEARAHNRRLVRESTVEDWLPAVRPGTGGSLRPLVDCADVHLVGDGAEPSTVSLLAWRPGRGTGERDAVAVSTGSDLLYSSADRTYLATRSWRAAAATGLHAFALEPGTGTSAPRTRYLGSGEVPGTVRDRWSFDAHDGTLRVASALGRSWNPRENAVTVLRETEDGLTQVGQVRGLGPREQIQSVRWFDDLAVVVTFRQVDPLYTVDLSDPDTPRLLGELKIPGFSAYLHPISADRVLGLGQDATARGRTKGAQASLFDLADLQDPRRIATSALGRRTSWAAEWEPRSFTWLADRGLGVAVASFWQRGFQGPRLVLVQPDGDALSTRVLPQALGRWDSDSARTLPLPDDRIAVVSRRGLEVVDLDRLLSPAGG